jgi:hypothetical protein
MNNSRMPGFVAEESFQRTEQSDKSLKLGYRFSAFFNLIPAIGGCPECNHVCAGSGCNKCMIENKNDFHKCSFICSSCWACDCASSIVE